MKLINPEGKKIIEIQDTTPLHIKLEDYSEENRSFQLIIKLKSEGASCVVEGRIQAKSNAQKSWTVHQVFENKDQKGVIVLRGVSEEKGVIELNGAGILMSSSQNCDARVEEKILLFDEGRGRMLPVLTVKTNEVGSASHSASLTPINEEILLYAQSRGYDLNTAKEMIKNGFLSFK